MSLILILSFLFITEFSIKPAKAASLTALSNTMSSSKVNTLSSHTIKFTTPTGANQNTDTITITFPSDFNFTSKTIGTVTFTHGATTGAENTETLAASATATAWGAAFSGTQNRVLTLTAPTDGIGAAELAASDKVIITYNSTNSTNPTAANSYSIDIAGTFGDTGSITVQILSDDQVAVSATVTQSLTFSISDNTIGFGTLSAAATRFATGDVAGSGTEASAHNLVAGTNASSGYTVTVNGATLANASADTITAIGASAVDVTTAVTSVGTEQFGIRMTASGGSGAVTAPYNGASNNYALDTSAFPDQVASAAGTTANTTYSVFYAANISSNTEAGSYTSTLTYVATANY